MPKIILERMSAQIDGDFVVFLIGMRVNAWWKVHKWLPVARAMMRMQKELRSLPIEQTGCLATRAGSPAVTIQYWRSFDHLEAYAADATKQHLPAWKAFNKAAKDARGDVGIWHETFLVAAGQYETLYSGMPIEGLAKASSSVAAKGHLSSARGRVIGTDQKTRTLEE